MKLKSIIYLTSLLLIAQQATAQQMIQKMFYSQYIDLPGRIMQTSNGDYLFTNERATSTQVFSTTISRLDSNLNLLWTKEYNYPGYIVNYLTIHEIAPDTFITWGGINISNVSNLAQFLLKIDGNGQVISSKMLFGLNNFYVKDIVWSHEQQRLVLYGKKEVTAVYDERMQVLAYDKDLNYVWGKEYVYGFHDDIISADFFGDNGLIVQADVAREVDSSSTEPCCVTLLIRIDSTGNVMWTKRVGNIPNLFQGWGYINAGKILVLDNHEIINVFNTNYFNNSPRNDAIVQKTDSLGNEMLTERIKINLSVSQITDQLFKSVNNQLVLRILLVANIILDENLQYVINRILTPSNNTFYISSQTTARNGGTVILGTSNSSHKIFVTRTDSLSNIGCNQIATIPYLYQPVSLPNLPTYYPINVTPVVILDSALSLTSVSLSLSDSILCSTATNIHPFEKSSVSVYPTVFREGINIYKDFKSSIRLEVFDSSGKKIKELQSTEDYLDLSELKNGLYLLRIESENQIYKYKIIKQ